MYFVYARRNMSSSNTKFSAFISHLLLSFTQIHNYVNFCLMYYHPECIRLQLKEEEAEKLTAIKCPNCVERMMDSPLYHESEYYFLSYFFVFDKMLITTERGCQEFLDNSFYTMD